MTRPWMRHTKRGRQGALLGPAVAVEKRSMHVLVEGGGLEARSPICRSARQRHVQYMYTTHQHKTRNPSKPNDLVLLLSLTNNYNTPLNLPLPHGNTVLLVTLDNLRVADERLVASTPHPIRLAASPDAFSYKASGIRFRVALP